MSRYWKEAEVEKIKDLVESGADEVEIASQLGRNILSVRVKVKRLRLIINKKG